MNESNALKNYDVTKLQSKILREYPWLTDVLESTLVADKRMPDCPIVFANDSFERMTRYPKEHIIGKNCRFLQGKLTNKSTVQSIRTAVDNGQPLEVEILNYRRDGIPFLNVFLMLPVHGSRNPKLVTHFLAIQKDVTNYVPDDTPITEWDEMKLAMMADATGLDYSAQIIIENRITGQQIIKLTEEDLIDFGIYSRKERKSLLKWVEDKVALTNSPKTPHSPKKYTQLGSVFGELSDKVNSKQPRNLMFWEKDGSDESQFACIKCYFESDIQVFTASKEITLEDLTARIKTIFGYSMILISSSTKKEISDDSTLHTILSSTKNTICFDLKMKLPEMQNGYDIIYNSCVPMMLVNKSGHLEYLNPAAEMKIPDVAGKKFSATFAKASKKLTFYLNSGFLTTVSISDGVKYPVHVSVSTCSRPGCYVLTIVILSVPVIVEGMKLVKSITGVKSASKWKT